MQVWHTKNTTKSHGKQKPKAKSHGTRTKKNIPKNMALLFRIPPYVQEYTIYIHVIVIMYEYKYNIYICVIYCIFLLPFSSYLWYNIQFSAHGLDSALHFLSLIWQRGHRPRLGWLGSCGPYGENLGKLGIYNRYVYRYHKNISYINLTQ